MNTHEQSEYTEAARSLVSEANSGDHVVAMQLTWIEALESGKYQQGIGKLRNANDEYCCFGVLCDVVIPGGWAQQRSGWFYHDSDARGAGAYPSDAVLAAIGGDPGSVNGRILTDWNDDHVASFTKIASMLREHYGFPERT